jgi:hypothetical protein
MRVQSIIKFKKSVKEIVIERGNMYVRDSEGHIYQVLIG